MERLGRACLGMHHFAVKNVERLHNRYQQYTRQTGGAYHIRENALNETTRADTVSTRWHEHREAPTARGQLTSRVTTLKSKCFERAPV